MKKIITFALVLLSVIGYGQEKTFRNVKVDTMKALNTRMSFPDSVDFNSIMRVGSITTNASVTQILIYDTVVIGDRTPSELTKFNVSGNMYVDTIFGAIIQDKSDPEYIKYIGDANDAAKIASALGVSDILKLSTTQTGTNLDLSGLADKTIDFFNGGDLTGFTGTITGNNTTLIVPPNKQVFSTSVSFAGTFNVNVTPEMFGATADSSVNSLDAINKSLELLTRSTTGNLKFQKNGNYYCDTSLTKYLITQDLNIDGNGATIWYDSDDITNETYAMWFSQSHTAFTVTGTLIENQADFILTSSISGISPGDGITIYTDETWDVSDKTYDKAFSTKVRRLTTDTIWLVDKLPYNITVANITQSTYTPSYDFEIHHLNISYKVGQFLSTDNLYNGLRVDATFDTYIHDCNIDGAFSALKINNTYGDIIERVNVDYQSDSLSIYGFNIGNQYNAVIRDCKISTFSHAITYGSFPSNNVLIDNCVLKSGANTNESVSFDVHSGNNITITNSIFRGFQSSKGTYIVDNCDVHSRYNYNYVFGYRLGGDQGQTDITVRNSDIFISEPPDGVFPVPIIGYQNIGDTVNGFTFIYNTVHADYPARLLNATTTPVYRVKDITIDYNKFYGRMIEMPYFTGAATATKKGTLSMRYNLFDSLQTHNIEESLPENYFSKIIIEGNGTHTVDGEFKLRLDGMTSADVIISHNEFRGDSSAFVNNSANLSIYENYFYTNETGFSGNTNLTGYMNEYRDGATQTIEESFKVAGELEINDADGIRAFMIDGTADRIWGNGTSGYIRMSDGFGTGLFWGTSAAIIANTIQFKTASTARMTINSSGFVGINDETPSELLDVNGNGNITGNFTIGGNLTVIGSISGGAYGSIGFADSTITWDATQNVYHKISNAADTTYRNTGAFVNLVFAGDSIQVVTAGDYQLTHSISFSGNNADEYHAEWFVNNVGQVGFGETQRDMTGTSIGTVAAPTIISISAGHWISLRIANINNNADPTIKASSITVIKM